ncbi:MAG: HD domain-containing protein [Bacteroidales bacterium]|nr:HD domain-containing protein [Bacteroidales bacterium]
MNNLIINSKRGVPGVYFKALEFAAHKHRAQKRKGPKGIPYINHPIEVASLIASTLENPSPELLVSAILHDTLEDTSATEEDIEKRFGHAVLSIVLEVTDDMKLHSKERKELQVEHAASLSPEARAIKIADKTCNIRDMLQTKYFWTKPVKIQYILWAIRVVEQIGSSHPPLKKVFMETIHQAEEILDVKFGFPSA